MNAWLLYVLGGMATLTGVLVDHWRRGGHFGSGDADLARILEAEHGIPAPTRRQRIVEQCIVKPLAAVAVVVAWPIALGLLFNERMRDRRMTSRVSSSDEEGFTPTREHLIERMTREAIEARERVTDPLGAAPDVPFGHLNPLWQVFADNIEAGDELWRFEARIASDWEFVTIHCGYARLRHGRVLQHLTTEQYDSEDEVGQAEKSHLGA
jgi:hypothetical protein